jgi:prepilin-type N-terminal cleavage/methylation domain-containing protein
MNQRLITSRAGMTIIEMLVVLVIVAGLAALSLNAVGALSATDLRDEAMRLTSSIKYTWTRAAVNGAQYRMVIDLDSGEYHTEVTDAMVVREAPAETGGEEGVLPEEAQERENEQNASASNMFGEESDPFGIHRTPTYEQVQKGALKPRKLEAGVKIYEVHVAYQDRPITSGKVAINFFPDGFQQPVIIVLSNEEGDDFYSLVNEPLTGRVKLFSERIEDRDMLVHGEDDD